GGIDNYLEFLPAYQFGQSIKSNTQNMHEKTFRKFWSWKNIANFEKTFSKHHRTSLMVAHEVFRRTSDFLRGERQFGANDLTGLNAGDANYALNNGYGTDYSMVSVFGRALYSYRDKYMLTATLRRDGSSNFAEGRRWGTFPSVAVAWRASEEAFFAPIKSVVNDMKLRFTYGEVGNANVNAFAYESNLVNTKTNNWGTAFQTANISNRDLTWETTRSWNAGIDLNFLNNRLEFVMDAYIQKH
ncbi:SusC/RagA family TonB-linked outer membrane protein, partial [Siphonobacter sp. BAB-5405]|uniref:TonB-dependent receptor domain-containing protein n=1 Tax=Siphonobacter sp. BAB-5405 TaxID=1864825 RepID=UPI000CB6ED2B